jgi:hypothetical protein
MKRRTELTLTERRDEALTSANQIFGMELHDRLWPALEDAGFEMQAAGSAGAFSENGAPLRAKGKQGFWDIRFEKDREYAYLVAEKPLSNGTKKLIRFCVSEMTPSEATQILLKKLGASHGQV